MFHEIAFEYKGKIYKRTVYEVMRNRFSMQSKNINYFFEQDECKNWKVFIGPEVQADVLELISVELNKIKRTAGKVDKRRKGLV